MKTSFQLMCEDPTLTREEAEDYIAEAFAADRAARREHLRAVSTSAEGILRDAVGNDNVRRVERDLYDVTSPVWHKDRRVLVQTRVRFVTETRRWAHAPRPYTGLVDKTRQIGRAHV